MLGWSLGRSAAWLLGRSLGRSVHLFDAEFPDVIPPLKLFLKLFESDQLTANTSASYDLVKLEVASRWN